MGRSKWLLLLLIPMLFGFDTRNPFRTRGPFKAYDFTIGGVGASACTDGVSCFCDTTSGDALRLFCEDFEDIDYYENTSRDWAAPPAGSPGDRGLGSQWSLLYGTGGSNTVWTNGNPASPQVGSTCSPSGSVCGNKEWCSPDQSLVVLGSAGTDCWDGNSGAAIDIQRSGDFDAEIASLSLDGGSGRTSDIGAGNQHFAYRFEPNRINNIVGEAAWSSKTEIGITYLVAYSSNMGGISLIDDPLKHDEYGNCPFCEYWFLGNIGLGSNAIFPFRGWFFKDSSVSESTCDGYVASATINRGQMDCNSSQVLIAANQGSGDGFYTQSTDWPFGQWACVRAHIKGMGTSNTEIKVYHNDELLIDIAGFNGAALHNKSYGRFAFNPYANANQGLGETPSTQTGYRYQDNMYIRNGPPLTCAEVGF